MAKCEGCGNELVEEAAFCHSCGTPTGVSVERQVGLEQPVSREPSTGGSSMPPPTPPCPPSGKPLPSPGAYHFMPTGSHPPIPSGVPRANEGAFTPPPRSSYPPPPGGPLPAPPMEPATPQAKGKRANAWAIASLVLGILSFMCLPLLGGVLAIAFALVARSRIRDSHGELGGGGPATAGLTLGIVNLAVLLVLAGLIVPVSIHYLGKTRTLTRTVSTQGAQHVVAELKVRSGELEVEGGAEGLFEGTFTFNVKDWEPSVDYSVRGDEGRLAVTQGGDWWAPDFWLVRNRWLVRLANHIPIDLRADLSSAQGAFRLGDLTLRSLEVESGSGEVEVELCGQMSELGRVELSQGSGRLRLDMRGAYVPYVQLDMENASGQTEIDLRGDWEGGLGGRLKCGSGDLSLYLPEDVGVRVRVNKGSGRLWAEGLRLESSDADGALYVNGAFRVSPVTIQVDIECSSGDIILKVGD